MMVFEGVGKGGDFLLHPLELVLVMLVDDGCK